MKHPPFIQIVAMPHYVNSSGDTHGGELYGLAPDGSVWEFSGEWKEVS